MCKFRPASGNLLGLPGKPSKSKEKLIKKNLGSRKKNYELGSLNLKKLGSFRYPSVSVNCYLFYPLSVKKHTHRKKSPTVKNTENAPTVRKTTKRKETKKKRKNVFLPKITKLQVIPLSVITVNCQK